METIILKFYCYKKKKSNDDVDSDDSDDSDENILMKKISNKLFLRLGLCKFSPKT